MQKKRLFTRLVLLASVVCLAAFAWADGASQVNSNAETVNTSADLFKAVSNAPENQLYEITVADNVTISSDKTLVISENKNIKLTIPEGSSLDFSGVTEEWQLDDSSYYVGIFNCGKLTIAGSGDLVMSKDTGNEAFIFCGGIYEGEAAWGSASLDITGSRLSATRTMEVSGSSGRVYAIYNYDGCTTEVNGGVVTATATGQGGEPYAIYNSNNATIWAGNFAGKLYNLTKCLHGGTYTSCDGTFNEKEMVADDCTAEQIAGGWRVFSKATLSPDNQCCVAEKGKSVTVSFDLMSGDSHVNVTSADVANLPDGITASVNGVTGSSTFTVTITNNSCNTTYGYLATVTAYNSDKYYKATTLLNIVVAQQGGSASDVKSALESDTVAAVSVSGDVDITNDINIVGDKILVVDEGNSLNMNGNALVIDSGKSLEMLGAGTTSTDEGPIFSVDGTLNIAEGKFCAASGDYIENTESADITIADGVQFYFGTDEAAAEKATVFKATYLASSNKTLTQGENGYWTVTTNATSSSSSSSGCNAGFAAAALAALAIIPTRRKRK